MARNRSFEDDDGRTIASMDNVPRHGTFGWLPPRFTVQNEEKEKGKQDYTREERKMYVLGSLKAVILIAGAYIIGLGLLILLILALVK